MPKPNKQIIIDAIIKEIEKGITYKKALGVVGGKWGIPPTTFDRYWKIANEQHTAKQDVIKKELTAIDTAAAINARKRAIMTADERKEYLTKILNGEITVKVPIVIAGKIMEYNLQSNHNDRIKALSELNKMEGDYAPTKISQTDKDGENVPPMIVLNQFLGAAIEIKESE